MTFLRFVAKLEHKQYQLVRGGLEVELWTDNSLPPSTLVDRIQLEARIQMVKIDTPTFFENGGRCFIIHNTNVCYGSTK